jgi:hypothetical protein
MADEQVLIVGDYSEGFLPLGPFREKGNLDEIAQRYRQRGWRVEVLQLHRVAQPSDSDDPIVILAGTLAAGVTVHGIFPDLEKALVGAEEHLSGPCWPIGIRPPS